MDWIFLRFQDNDKYQFPILFLDLDASWYVLDFVYGCLIFMNRSRSIRYLFCFILFLVVYLFCFVCLRTLLYFVCLFFGLMLFVFVLAMTSTLYMVLVGCG